MLNAKIQPGLNGQKQTLVCEHNVAAMWISSAHRQ